MIIGHSLARAPLALIRGRWLDMESKIVKHDFKGLHDFVRGVQAGYYVKVGIMGNKNTRNDKNSKGQTNADIGFIHEYGRPKTAKSPAIPMRSFLRLPLLFKKDRILKEIAEIEMVKKLAKGDFLQILTDLGIVCERVILDAFYTSGWGSWPANAPSTIKKKARGSGSTQPLTDLGFLRRSITSQVVKP